MHTSTKNQKKRPNLKFQGIVFTRKLLSTVAYHIYHSRQGRDMGGVVWIASYPRSGNTWIRAFLHSLLNITGGKEEFDLNSLGSAPPGTLRHIGMSRFCRNP